MKYILLSCLLISACRMDPVIFYTREGKQGLWMGGSLATKADYVEKTAQLADGSSVRVVVQNGDETVVPNSYIGYKTLTGLGEIANEGEAIREKGATIRSGQEAGVKETEIIEGTKRLSILNPIEP